ncbi:MAG: hypothetical protein ABJL67_20340 [Sulfitobacter sp.]
MLPDTRKYWHHVDRLDVSDAQKSELINIVFRAMQSGVDRAFQDDPVQMALASRGHERAFKANDVVELSKDDYRTAELAQTFNDQKG